MLYFSKICDRIYLLIIFISYFIGQEYCLLLDLLLYHITNKTPYRLN
jgi:hypothetical protein